jgi:hypothetical protein
MYEIWMKMQKVQNRLSLFYNFIFNEVFCLMTWKSKSHNKNAEVINVAFFFYRGTWITSVKK